MTCALTGERGKDYPQVTWSHPDSLEQVTKRRSNGTTVCNDERSKSQTSILHCSLKCATWLRRALIRLHSVSEREVTGNTEVTREILAPLPLCYCTGPWSNRAFRGTIAWATTQLRQGRWWWSDIDFCSDDCWTKHPSDHLHTSHAATQNVTTQHQRDPPSYSPLRSFSWKHSSRDAHEVPCDYVTVKR
jgi:hypothetical protein